MSYDIDLQIFTGREFFTVESGFNITYNVSPMFKLAFGNDDGLNAIDKMRCSDALPLIARAVEHACNPVNQPAYSALNPPNGWGSHDGVIQCLHDLQSKCNLHPLCKLRIT